jgi:hydrogenase expression/formation protein HypE
VATSLKEIALQSGVDLVVREEALPVKGSVRGACSILGLDPLYVANEGKMLVFVSPDATARAIEILRSHPLGIDAAVIGEVTGRGTGKVSIQMKAGGVRVVEMLSGEQLPRIC